MNEKHQGQKKMKKNILYLAFATIIISSGFCLDCNYKKHFFKKDAEETVKEPTTKNPPDTFGYIAPAEVEVLNGCNCFLTGSFLYWSVIEKGLNLGYTYKYEASDIITVNKKPIKMDSGYHPGFKVGFGVNKLPDNWGFLLDYTRLFVKEKANKTITSPTINDYIDSSWDTFSTSDKCSYVEARWKIKMDMLSIQMGRECYFGKKLQITPNFGLKGGWIDQKYNSDITSFLSTDTTTAQMDNRSKSWLVGPRAGIQSKWQLFKALKIMVNVAGSFLYQDFNTEINQKIPAQTTVTTETRMLEKRKQSQVTPNFEGLLGLSLDKYFSKNSWHFDFSAGYEFQYYFDQNQIRQLFESTKTSNEATNAGDLMFHGLTISARLDF